MRKEPKKTPVAVRLLYGFKVIIGLEVAAFSGAWYIWYRMNHSRDFRHRMYKNCPSVLNAYYWTGEKLGGISARQSDYVFWGISDE